MGIFPDRMCSVCGEWFYTNLGSTHRDCHTHCAFLKAEIGSLRQSLVEAHEQLEGLVNAHRERGECTEELKQVAYEFGMSVRPDEFVWLDEEIERIKEENRRKRGK